MSISLISAYTCELHVIRPELFDILHFYIFIFAFHFFVDQAPEVPAIDQVGAGDQGTNAAPATSSDPASATAPNTVYGAPPVPGSAQPPSSNANATSSANWHRFLLAHGLEAGLQSGRQRYTDRASFALYLQDFAYSDGLVSMRAGPLGSAVIEFATVADAEKCMNYFHTHITKLGRGPSTRIHVVCNCFVAFEFQNDIASDKYMYW